MFKFFHWFINTFYIHILIHCVWMRKSMKRDKIAHEWKNFPGISCLNKSKHMKSLPVLHSSFFLSHYSHKIFSLFLYLYFWKWWKIPKKKRFSSSSTLRFLYIMFVYLQALFSWWFYEVWCGFGGISFYFLSQFTFPLLFIPFVLH